MLNFFNNKETKCKKTKASKHPLNILQEFGTKVLEDDSGPENIVERVRETEKVPMVGERS